MYIQKHDALFQEPRRIVLKQTRTLQLSGRRRKLVVKKEEAMYIPLLETLQTLLNNTTIYEQVLYTTCSLKNLCAVYRLTNKHYTLQVMDGHDHSTDGILSDYCDGKQYHGHSLFSADPVALQLILYYDELELCNPLGSRRKQHKIGT